MQSMFKDTDKVANILAVAMIDRIVVELAAILCREFEGRWTTIMIWQRCLQRYRARQ